MSEAATLVSWDAPQDLGKVPGSEWVCSVGSLEAIRGFERSGETVTDETIRGKAQGRQQHLGMVQFPEGYLAARVIDSETGRVLTGEGATCRNGGPISCNCGAIHNSPAVLSALLGRPIGISGDREIASVDNSRDGTQTVVRPTEVGGSEPDYISRLRTTTHITPQSHSLYVVTEGPVGVIDSAHAKLDIRQDDSEVRGELAMWVSNGWENTGQLNLGLGSDGQVEELRICKRGFLEALGVNVSGLDLNPDNDWAEIADSQQQALILGATAEALGFERWRGLDLRLTASGLYATMGQRNFDPVAALVPRA